MIEEWQRIAWHLDGLPWRDFLRLSVTQRFRMNEVLNERIEKNDPEARPKNWR